MSCVSYKWTQFNLAFLFKLLFQYFCFCYYCYFFAYQCCCSNPQNNGGLERSISPTFWRAIFDRSISFEGCTTLKIDAQPSKAPAKTESIIERFVIYWLLKKKCGTSYSKLFKKNRGRRPRSKSLLIRPSTMHLGCSQQFSWVFLWLLRTVIFLKICGEFSGGFRIELEFTAFNAKNQKFFKNSLRWVIQIGTQKLNDHR